MPSTLSTATLRLVILLALAAMVVLGVVNTPASAGLESDGAELSFIESSSLQGAQGEKTIDQVQKNIQVLNGLPQSQLIPMMNLISSSLGVRCTFCHINKSGQWDFASDEKPEKGTAREMIKMVQGINKNTFKGATEVSCFTCHRGRSHPASVPPLPLPEPPRPAAEPQAAPAASPGASPAGPPKEANPTIEQVLSKFQEAMGGSAAIAKLKTTSMKGNLVTSNGMSLGYELYQSSPDRIYVVVTTPRGVMTRGFDGTIAWEQSARGVRDIAGDELMYLRRYPDVFGDIKLKEQFSSLTVAGKDRIDGRDVWVVRGTTVMGSKRERLFFDAQTGLLVRRIISTPTIIGVIPEQVDFEDYRDVDGLKLPFKVRVSTVDPNSTSIREFTEIKLNLPVDESKFKKPAPKPVASPNP